MFFVTTKKSGKDHDGIVLDNIYGIVFKGRLCDTWNNYGKTTDDHWTIKGSIP